MECLGDDISLHPVKRSHRRRDGPVVVVGLGGGPLQASRSSKKTRKHMQHLCIFTTTLQNQLGARQDMLHHLGSSLRSEKQLTTWNPVSPSDAPAPCSAVSARMRGGARFVAPMIPPAVFSLQVQHRILLELIIQKHDEP